MQAEIPKIVERPYQTACVEAMFGSMREGREYGLVVLPTGAGKTVIFSRFVEGVYGRYGHLRRRIRTCILAHREKLVSQAREKLLRVWPAAAPRIGMACASTGEDVDIDSDIVIGSIQTITNRLKWKTIDPFDVILVDEGHRIPYKERASSYNNFLALTAQLSPRRKVFAFTATPYKLGHGYIYGTRHKAGQTNWFADGPVFQVPMDDLIDAGYLVNYRIKQAVDIGPELRSVPLASTGDYKTDALGTIMCKFNHAAVNAWRDYGEGRRHVVAFCATIAHAEAVAASFSAAGVPACAVHSGLRDDERERRLSAFSDGSVHLLASVDALIEGWDETGIDCILMLRPTKAPMIYVQQVGRGLRPHPGKENLLILDLADNVRNHGFPSDPLVRVPGHGLGGEPPVKICPECSTAVHASIMKCPECGHIFVAKVYEEPERVTLEETGPALCRYTKAMPATAPILAVKVYGDEDQAHLHITFKDPPTGKLSFANYYIRYWTITRAEFAVEWKALTNEDDPPRKKEDLLARLLAVNWPGKGLFHRENKGGARYPNLCGWVAPGWVERFPEVRYVEDGAALPASPVIAKRRAVYRRKTQQPPKQPGKGPGRRTVVPGE